MTIEQMEDLRHKHDLIAVTLNSAINWTNAASIMPENKKLAQLRDDTITEYYRLIGDSPTDIYSIHDHPNQD